VYRIPLLRQAQTAGVAGAQPLVPGREQSPRMLRAARTARAEGAAHLDFCCIPRSSCRRKSDISGTRGIFERLYEHLGSVSRSFRPGARMNLKEFHASFRSRLAKRYRTALGRGFPIRPPVKKWSGPDDPHQGRTASTGKSGTRKSCLAIPEWTSSSTGQRETPIADARTTRSSRW